MGRRAIAIPAGHRLPRCCHRTGIPSGARRTPARPVQVSRTSLGRQIHCILNSPHDPHFALRSGRRDAIGHRNHRAQFNGHALEVLPPSAPDAIGTGRQAASQTVLRLDIEPHDAVNSPQVPTHFHPRRSVSDHAVPAEHDRPFVVPDPLVDPAPSQQIPPRPPLRPVPWTPRDRCSSG